MIGKIYFYILFVSNVFGMYYTSIVGGVNLGFLIQLVVVVLLMLGLYSYTFKKHIFEAKNWRIIFYLILLNILYGAIKSLMEGSIYTSFGLQELFLGFLGFLILAFPSYYSIYHLGFSQKGTTKLKKNRKS